MKGDGRVYPRGRVWWVAYYLDGQELRESSKSRKRKEAVRLLRQRIGEIAEGTPRHFPVSSPESNRTVGMSQVFDLIERHHQINNCTSPANRWCLRRLRRRFAGYTVRRCTALAITHYMADMQRQGRKPETINREITVLRSALRLGHKHDLVQRVPTIQKLPEHTVRDDFFTREEIDALVSCLPLHLRDVVLFGFLTGWRKGEITGLKWTNVNRSARFIRLKPDQNKTRMARVLALEGELATLIERRWPGRKTDFQLTEWVFHRAGKPLGDFRETWLKACRKAGLGHRLFHSLRRSAARNMSLQGIPEKVIMSIMGHKTRVMFDRYNIISESDQRAYVKRLYGPQHGQ